MNRYLILWVLFITVFGMGLVYFFQVERLTYECHSTSFTFDSPSSKNWKVVEKMERRINRDVSRTLYLFNKGSYRAEYFDAAYATKKIYESRESEIFEGKNLVRYSDTNSQPHWYEEATSIARDFSNGTSAKHLITVDTRDNRFILKNKEQEGYWVGDCKNTNFGGYFSERIISFAEAFPNLFTKNKD
jgi:hypothetical protein